jgi:hypothetical protein
MCDGIRGCGKVIEGCGEVEWGETVGIIVIE